MTGSYTNMVIAGHCLAHAFSPNDYEPTFSTCGKRENGSWSARRSCHCDCPGRFLEGVFCGFGSAASRRARIRPEAGGTDRRQDTDNVRVHAGAASWPHVGADENTVFVSFLSRDPRRRNYELDLLKEVHRKQLGKLRVVVVPDSIDEIGRFADHVLSLHAPGLGDEYRAPVDVILAQLLGLFCSLRLGLKPDCPSPNGAISRVVSHVNIY